MKAHGQVRLAINRGDLVRPDKCSRCGDVPGPASDGRSKIHAHHKDYSKPLDVEWLCAKCHRFDTPLPKVMCAGMHPSGEENGFSKLTNADVISAKRLREKGLTFQSIGDRFGVGRHAIMRAVNGQTWKSAAPKATGSFDAL